MFRQNKLIKESWVFKKCPSHTAVHTLGQGVPGELPVASDQQDAKKGKWTSQVVQTRTLGSVPRALEFPTMSWDYHWPA